MIKRPKINVELTRLDKAISFLAGLGLLSLWVIVFIYFTKLPAIIPIHFNLRGNINGYGNKAYLLLLPIISTLVFIGLKKLNQYPHLFNYPIGITIENAPKQYLIATRLIRLTNLSNVIVFLLITLKIAGVKFYLFNNLFIPLIFILLFFPLLYYGVALYRNK